ncbi:MAG: hypothetical protein DHS20C15_04970 [Planctomycetota bacterium]|nr:MAG: hypothetical protein DHS20C15_04970 [Planctomycetota bacterium]
MTSYRVEVLEATSLFSPHDDPAAAFERVWKLIPKDRPKRLWGFLDADGGLFVKGLRSLRRNALRSFSEGQRTRRERWHLARMAERGLPVPRLMAYGQESRAGFPVRSFLVEQLLRDTVDLDTWLPEHDEGEAERSRVVHELGQLVQRMHDAQVFHGDLSCRNILVCDSGDLHLIDCPRARIDPLPPRRQMFRRSDLFRLVRGLIRAGLSDVELRVMLRAARAEGVEWRVIELAHAHDRQATRRRSLPLTKWLLSGH